MDTGTYKKLAKVVIKIKKTFVLIVLVITTLILVIHLSFYWVARQQAVSYLEKKYSDMDISIGWPSQSIISNILDGWYKIPVYTQNKKQEIKFYVNLNMFNGLRNDDFLFWALQADAEDQFNDEVREIIPTAKVDILHQLIDEDAYYNMFGKGNIQYVHNSSGDLVLVVHIGWEGKRKLSKEEFAKTCSEVGAHFLSTYPVYELQFSYTYQDNEKMYTTTINNNDNIEQILKDHLYQGLYTNIHIYKF
ncbi:hypothetical protein SAMN04488689_11757 [Paenibacillus sp. cl6col]|uniref:Uncharacterized protein n=1 Tax=Paenibacillus alvei TaxID=44250 RepID=A0ABT4E7K3_PAEAL|nr:MULTISPECIES: hypothetical protein [Paenibacillus]MCY9529711.1 hypothetical protein [Paenibacillus alvei]SDG49348.1 hypothetical protein SAMN04488689_11757 [Paenibacillus sp. cl6col]